MENQDYQIKQPLEQPQKRLNKKMLLMSISVLIIVLAVFIFVWAMRSKPYQVLTPNVYPEGTTISLYKNIPAGFPNDVILEDKTLDYSGTVQNPDGKKQTTVSYISDKNMSEITEMYASSLVENSWKISNSSKFEKVSIIQATKNTENLTITIAPIKDAKTMVTFQYEK